MIRFRRVFDLTTDVDKRVFAQASDVFRLAFPDEPEGIEHIRERLEQRRELGFEPVLLVSTNTHHSVTGFAFLYYFPDLRYGYLQYIASHQGTPARGIGAALYEALREFLAQRSARGLFLDVPPSDPKKVSDRSHLQVNRRRLRFYARYGIREIKGTRWDLHPNPRNDGYLTTLLYDPLGRRQPRLERADASRVVRRILVEQFRYDPDDPFVIAIVRSFADDPVRLAPLEGEQTAAKPTMSKYLAPIKVVVVQRHTIHHLRERGYVERPVRVNAIVRGLEGLPVERISTRRFPEEHLTAVHHPSLVAYLKAMAQRLDAGALIYPEVFPIRRPDKVPHALEDRAGYYCVDTFTPLARSSYGTARDATNVALTAADLLADGERFAYALCRPPGHHAERRVYGGFCYFNNSAVAAHYLSGLGKVALLDIDYHHGNGTQAIFYDRADVLFCSLHGDPAGEYPYYWGYAGERGTGLGAGTNFNYPLPFGTEEAAYLAALDAALVQVRRFVPDILLVSLGVDTFKGDPEGLPNRGFRLQTDSFTRCGEMLAGLKLPVCVIQEGGYLLDSLGANVVAFLQGLST